MNTPIDVTLGLSILAAVVGFIAGAATATWCYRRRPTRWSADALCPRRSNPEPVIREWTPSHAGFRAQQRSR